MDKENDYYRIRAGIYKHPEEGFINQDGKYEWNPHFKERLMDWQEYFNMKLLKPISEKIGMDGWAVFFLQFSQYDESFFVDIYVDDEKSFKIIWQIIQSEMPTDIKLRTITNKGKVSDYLKT